MKSSEAIIPVKIENGTMKYDKALLDAKIGRLADDLYLMCFLSTRKRTEAQNAYYWGVVLKTLSEVGEGGSYTKEEWHDILGFLRTREYLIQDETRDVVRSTSSMTASDFTEYLELVARFAAENGIVIPEPRQYGI
jgi:hypothetical protein